MTGQISAASTEVLREAAAWMTRLKASDVSELDHREFIEWLKRSPVHVKHYLELASLDVQLGDAALFEGMDLDELPRQSRSNVLPWTVPRTRDSESKTPRQHARPRWLRWTVTAAAASVITVGLFLGTQEVVNWPDSDERYHSAVGELRSIALSDGSIVTLNTQSEIEVRYSEESRTVELARGEALFRVARNRSRPFRVLVDRTVIQALGTEFNVYRHSGGAVVTVVEGRVAVLPQDSGSAEPLGRQEPSAPGPGRVRARLELSAGEQLAIAPNAAVRRLELSEIARVTTWTQRRLAFNQAPVAEVVAELNRYNHEQLVVEDPELARRAVTGTFESNDLESFILFLKQEGGVSVREGPRGTRHLTAAEHPIE